MTALMPVVGIWPVSQLPQVFQSVLTAPVQVVVVGGVADTCTLAMAVAVLTLPAASERVMVTCCAPAPPPGTCPPAT